MLTVAARARQMTLASSSNAYCGSSLNCALSVRRVTQAARPGAARRPGSSRHGAPARAAGRTSGPVRRDPLRATCAWASGVGADAAAAGC
jgi:hypothetical protein